MRRISRLSAVFGLALLALGFVGICLSANAEDWIILGPKAEGMGGAGVATGDDATAYYWNPAATTKNKKYGLYIPFGTSISGEGDIIASVDRLATTGSDIRWNEFLNSVRNGTPITDTTQVGKVLDFFSYASTELDKKGQGLLCNVSAGAVFTFGSVTFFGDNLLYANVDPVADTINLSFSSSTSSLANITNMVGPGPYTHTPAATDLANDIANSPWWPGGLGEANEFVWLAEQGGADTSNPNIQEILKLIAQSTAGGGSGVTLAENGTGLIINGLNVTEFGASYSHYIWGEKLSIGGNFKVMEGRTYYNYINFQDLETGDQTLDDIKSKKNLKTSGAFGIDVGVLYSPAEIARFGVTARNVNTPTFTYAGGKDLKLKPQVRAGASLNALGKWLVLGADYDITKNKSVLLDGYTSQTYALGAEINLIGVLKIRTGISENLASKYAAKVYSAGVGLHLIWLDVDLAASVSPSKVKLETAQNGGQTMPQKLSTSLSVALRF